jgi:hypothetical protein
MRVAMGADCDTARTEIVAAAGAHRGAVATERFTASLAVAAVVFAHRLAAIGARRLVPIAQVDKGVAGRVGVQDLIDQQEQVIEPPALKGEVDRPRAVPFAEPLILDVRMRRVGVSTGRIRIEGHEAVRPLVVGREPLEADLKPTEQCTVQLDRLGRHPKLFSTFVAHLAEFVLQCDEVLNKVRSVGRLGSGWPVAPAFDPRGQIRLQATGQNRLVGRQPRGRTIPAAFHGPIEAAGDRD